MMDTVLAPTCEYRRAVVAGAPTGTRLHAMSPFLFSLKASMEHFLNWIKLKCMIPEIGTTTANVSLLTTSLVDAVSENF